MATNRICSIPDCGKNSWARGWCSAHLHRWRKFGDPLGGGTPWGEPIRHLTEVIMPYKGAECLPWPYAHDSRGYGQIYTDGRTRRVTRVICERIHGPPPTNKHEAAHSCGNGRLKCCTPSHLSWKTSAENSADAIAHGTWNHGEKVPQSKLKKPQVTEIRALKGKLLQREIAEMYGVSQQLISKIFKDELWRSHP